MTLAIAIIRLLVGWIFLVEGILKFLLPDELGVGRFASIGIPAPQVMAPFVGVVEIVCGALVLAGFVTRLASIAQPSPSNLQFLPSTPALKIWPVAALRPPPARHEQEMYSLAAS